MACPGHEFFHALPTPLEDFVKAFILAAGFGTRLRPFTDEIPKPLIPVLNQPVMERMIHLCHRHGFVDLVANLHYKGEKIQQAFGDGATFGVNLQYSWEKELLGTAGGVRRQADFLGQETFAVVSGDVVTDLDLTEMLAFHRMRGALITMAVKEVADPSRFGVVVTDPEGRITSFQEKPAPGTEKSRLVNTGIYIVEPEILAHIPPHLPFDFGSQLFPMLVAQGAPVYAMSTEAYWSDVGTLDQYLHTNWALLRANRGRRIGKNTIVEPGVLLAEQVLIGDNCHIHSGAVVMGWTCVGDGTVLKPNARVLGSVLWSGEHGLTIDDEVVLSIVTNDKRVRVKVA